MAKIKVYELAKEVDKQSKDILGFLQGKGIEAKAPQSSVDEETAFLVRKAFGRGTGKVEGSALKTSDSKAGGTGTVDTKAGEIKAAEIKNNEAKSDGTKNADSGAGDAKAASATESPKKKKKIIFVSNPQNSKMPGRKNAPSAAPQNKPGGTKHQEGKKAGQSGARTQSGNKPQAAAPVRPIKPLTPPSPTPSVQMVPSRQQQPKSQTRPVQDNTTAAAPEVKQPVEAVSQSPQENTAFDNKSRNEGRDSRERGNRPQDNQEQSVRNEGAQSQGSRPQADQSQGRTQGGQSQGRPQADRNQGRPQGGQSQGRSQGDQSQGRTQGGQYQGRSQGDQSQGRSQGGQYQGRTQGGQYQGRSQGDQSQGRTQGGQYQGRSQGDQSQGRPQGGQYQGRTQGDQSQGRPQGGQYQGRTQGDQSQGRPQGGQYQGRTQGDQSQGRPQGGQYQGRPQGDRNQGRPQGGQYQGRPQGDRNQGRPQGGQYQGRTQGDQSQGRPQGGQYQGRSQGGQYQGSSQGGQQYGNRNQAGQGDRNRNDFNSQRTGGQYQGRGGTGYGKPSFGRPEMSGSNQGDRRSGGSGQGGSRPYNNTGRDGRPAGGQGDRFKNTQQPKGFVSEAPGKGTEKKRDEEKRRYSQEKDKRSKKDHIYEEDSNLKNKPGRFIKPEKKEAVKEEVIKVIIVPEMITIKDLADKMKLQPSGIVKKLFLAGKIVTVNQEVSYEDAESIAMDYNILCEREVKVDVIEELLKEEDEEAGELMERPPVICVMGHVDHGKTTLLDAIRKTHVTDREAGGITQHIGAYTVNLGDRKITFLDTPGHEAFTAMRMRGANSTDIAILVVAADDGVMPQTVEAINHAKAAGIEILVAVNKIDKPSANIDRVKQELAEYELISEDWGGSTVFAPVSAKSGEGIEQLLEMILLTADIMELKANPQRMARGLVIEAQLDKGRGPVATVLVQKGTLHVGDFISAGACHGKVRAMIDDKGRRVKEAGPSAPVEILGLSDVPNAGEVFIAHENDKSAKSYAETYLSQNKEKMLEDTKSRMSLDDLFSQIKEGNLKELNLIVKADVQGSVEAVKQSLLKLTNEEVVVKCIHGGVGAINESDVTLASTSNAIIIGFNVRPDVTAKATAEREGVDVRLYKVIYQAIEDIEAAMKGMLDPVFEEKVLGHAEVRQIFKASAIGNIAGAYVLDGIFQRSCKVRITREGEMIFEGGLSSLKRFKDDVKEVKTGFECGLVFDNFDQIKEFDIVEAYTMVEVPR